MNLLQILKKKFLLLAVLLPAVISVTAQNAEQAAPKQEEGSNLLAILLVIVTIVLALIIWGMGQALVGISRLAVDKQKKSSAALSIILFIGLSFLSQTTFAQDAAAAGAEAAQSPANYGGLSPHNFWVFVAVIGIEVAAIFFLAFSIKRVYQEIIPADTLAKQSSVSNWWSNLDKKFFTKAVSVEKEADVMLDHDYDGIKELDNPLPPWWKYGFYITIAVAFIYMFIFHVSGAGKNPTQEYAAEIEKAKIEKEAFEATNKDKIDETKVPMADAAGIANGEKLYDANCVACHMKGGAGNVGPNLADDYWLHKGSLNDIYKSIKVGYPDKGMQSWAKNFSPKEISQLSSYIKTLHGTNPPGAKAAQGELFTDAGATTDSTAAAPKVDSVKVAAPAAATAK